MTARITQFRWKITEAGYRLLLGTAVGESSQRLYLTDAQPFGVAYPGFRYTPEPGLFRSLAALDCQEDKVLDFAGRWGMLTTGVLISLEDNTVGVGEPLDLWKTETADLSLGVRLWDMIKKHDLPGLGRYIEWPDAFGVSFKRRSEDASQPRFKGTIPWLPGVVFDGSQENIQEMRWIASRETNPELLATFQQGDLIGPAWHQLQHIVNAKLEGNVSARLLWNHSRKRTRLSLHQVPDDLISALWLQLARAIEGDRQYQQCEECQTWFEISSPDGGRSDKKFCGTPCRAKYWRKSKGEK